MLPRRTELPLLLRTPTKFVGRYWLPLLILLIGATADAITTHANSVAYGAGIEVHPVQRWMFELVGNDVGVPLAKCLQVGFVVFVAAIWKRWCPWVLGGCGGLYGLAAASNHFLWL
ncbi:hypothetical protein [Humisphaera borealis]|uniref:DUF5658 domain-containing protein n=1 Tax=Humisphaera borealis TaxID=2807512 RepID=A0A7M2WTA5_9BACT|nr:hypothetical protein [Humisphaera borealis]QOV88696.1 hypothetical protein IPV69_21050 [Humisphaera borealis]